MLYKQIPEYPKEYSSGTIISRLIDGLGYRYYWATENLTKKDLQYRPSTEGQSTYETIEHIYWLSIMIVNCPQSIPNIRLTPADLVTMTYDTLKENTLLNFKKASDLYGNMSEEDITSLKVAFLKDENKTEFPFWHMINGPISDALYHTGQIVSFRRTTGNPIHPNVSVFMGKTDI